MCWEQVVVPEGKKRKKIIKKIKLACIFTTLQLLISFLAGINKYI